MTKIYIGNDAYEVYLSSGKSLVLTEEEIKEIVDDNLPHSSSMVTYGNKKKNRRTASKRKRQV